jgi:serine/threonine protein kinase
MTLEAGMQLGSYEIVSCLGSGGMGEVYRAKDRTLGRDVALKILRDDLTESSDRLRRFEQEARAASALNHPNIVTIYEIGKEGSTPFIAMELVEGETLRAHLNDGRPSAADALDWGTQMAESLAKAHGAGIVHRDLKPDTLTPRRAAVTKRFDCFAGKKSYRDSGMSHPSNLPTYTRLSTSETRRSSTWNGLSTSEVWSCSC